MHESGEQHIESVGEVVKSIKGNFEVKLESGQTVKCHIGGKIRKNKINILVGDRVSIQISPYDLARGIITYRL